MQKYGYNGPEEFRPLSPWAYFGYQILFSIPLVGFICLIIFTFNGKNINRRSFARSYWCSTLLSILLIFALIALASALGLWTAALDYFTVAI